MADEPSINETVDLDEPDERGYDLFDPDGRA
jgi:hypothetical protein